MKMMNTMKTMKKLILSLLAVLLWASVGWGADRNIYISSSAAAGGDGSITTPYDSLSDLTTTVWTAIAGYVSAGDDVYINLKGGETHGVTSGNSWFVTARNGADGHPITIQSYGTGRAIISGRASNGISIQNCSYITVDNIHFTGNTGSGYKYLLGGASGNHAGIIVKNCLSTLNGANGITVQTTDSNYTLSGVSVLNNSTSANANQGIFVDGYIIAPNINGNTSNGDAVTGISWGILTGGLTTRYAASGWTQDSGTIYYRERTTNVEDVVPILTAYGFLTAAVAAPDPGEYWYDSANSLLYVNIGADANSKQFEVIQEYLDGATIENNTVQNTNDSQGSEGHGIGLEFGTKDTVVKNNFSINNAGGGLVAMMTRNCSFISNIVYGNLKQGISSRAGADLLIYHNTFFDNAINGIVLTEWNGATIKNNIVAANDGIGIYNNDGAATATIDEDYNCVNGNETAVDGLTLGEHSITTDPLLTSDGKLLPSSPAIDAGVWITGINMEGQSGPNGKGIYREPDCGAFQDADIPKRPTGPLETGGKNSFGFK